jgi:hypothetical protein
MAFKSSSPAREEKDLPFPGIVPLLPFSTPEGLMLAPRRAILKIIKLLKGFGNLRL